MRKKLLLFTAVTIMTFSLTACDQSQSSAQKTQVKQQASTTASQAQQEASSSQNTNQTTTPINQESLQNAQTTNNAVNVDPSASYIGEDKAMAIALEHSKYTQQDLLFSYVKLDYDDGIWSYDVEFYAENKEYDYEIDAITGTILSFDFDMEGNFNPNQAGNTQAANSGSSAAGTSSSQANTSGSNQNYGTQSSNTQTTAASAPTTNTAANSTPAVQAPAASQPAASAQNTAPSQASAGTAVSIDTARQTALARVPGATESHIRIHTDYDDGRTVYEGKIIYNSMEYDFEIDAATGNIIDWDAESIYD